MHITRRGLLAGSVILVLGVTQLVLRLGAPRGEVALVVSEPDRFVIDLIDKPTAATVEFDGTSTEIPGARTRWLAIVLIGGTASIGWAPARDEPLGETLPLGTAHVSSITAWPEKDDRVGISLVLGDGPQPPFKQGLISYRR